MDEESRSLRWQALMRRLAPVTPVEVLHHFEAALDDPQVQKTIEAEKLLRTAMLLSVAGQIDILETLFKKFTPEEP